MSRELSRQMGALHKAIICNTKTLIDSLEVVTETPLTVQNTTSGASGSTLGGVKGFSIMFEGSGGTLGGVPVDSGYSTGKFASDNGVLASQDYTVPDTVDSNFPNSPRVLIEYVQ